MIILCLCITLLILLPAVSWIGWEKGDKHIPTPPPSSTPFISILIPFRNEAHRIHLLQRSMDALRYSPQHFEVLLIDDHSTDNGNEQVAAWADSRAHIHCVQLLTGEGKKAALTQGVTQARGEIIVTTDADCLFPPEWLSTYAEIFSNPNVMISPGLVAPAEIRSWMHHLLQLEMAALTGVSAGMALLGWVTSCNGANLAFRKSAFLKVNGYSGNEQIPSGDDEFLLNKIANSFPDGVHYSTATSTVVKTALPDTWEEVVSQRVRWASKWKYNKKSKWAGPVLFLAYTGYVAAWVYALIFPEFLQIAAVLTVLKFGFDYLLMRTVTGRWEVHFPLPYFLMGEVIYPFYYITFSFLAQRRQYVWKGRRYEEALTKEY
jgi:poly-beta-1,6-N-acetyl-D-glucosamine synthase